MFGNSIINPKKTTGKIFFLSLLVLPVLFFAFFFAWPIARVFYSSFMSPNFTLANYYRAFFDPPFLYILYRTFLIAALVTSVCLVISYPLAAYIASRSEKGFKIGSALVTLPLWTSVLIRSFAWMILFQRNGPVNYALKTLGLTAEPIEILQTLWAVVIGMVHILMPFMVLPLIAVMRKMDTTLVRAAGVLGARPLSSFLRVYLPLTMPGITSGVSLVFISAIGFYVTPALLGGKSGMMVAVLIEQEASVSLNWPYASAMATVLMVAALLCYGAYVFALRRMVTGAAK